MYLRNIISTFISKGFIMVLTFGLVILSTNLWGPEGRGIISITLADVAIIVIFNNLLGGSCISYFTPKVGAEKLLIPAYIWIFLSTLVGSAVFKIFQPQVNAIYLFLITLVLSWHSIHLKIFAAKENFKLFNILSLLLPLFNLIFIVIIYFIFRFKSYNSYFTGYIAALVLLWIISIFMTREYVNGKLVISKEVIKKSLAYGWQTEFATLIQFANYRLSYFLILHYMNVSSVGLYSVGIALAEAIWLIVRSISTVQYSKIVNNIANNDGIKLTIDSAKISLYFSVAAALALVLIPTKGYELIFGKDFSHVRPIMIMLLPGIIASSFSNVHGHYFTATGKTMPSIIKSLVGLIFTVALMPWMIVKFGLAGASIATTISYVASSFYFSYLFYKNTKFDISHLWINWKRFKSTH